MSKESVDTSPFLTVNVFSRDGETVIIKQFPAVTFQSIFGTIGGFLGLLLGASVFSVVELLQLIASVLVFVFKGCNGKFTNNKNGPNIVEK